jgi:hypothetical protein
MLGGELREHDLGPAQQRETRRGAATAIAPPARPPCGVPFTFPALSRLSLAAGALSLLLVAGLWLGRRGTAPVADAEPFFISSREIVQFDFDDDIDKLAARLDSGFRRFHSRHGRRSRGSGFDRKASALRNRINIFSSSIGRELENTM